jgi:AcrR family transcriptional regulator
LVKHSGKSECHKSIDRPVGLLNVYTGPPRLLAVPPGVGARERILDTAYELFSRNGIRAVGIGRIVEESGVAKMSLYNNFASKDDLVLAFLELREERWTHGWLAAEVERRAEDPEARLLAFFDALDDWFHRDDYEGCSFINTLLEVHGTGGPIEEATVRHLDVIRAMIEHHAEQAGIASPESVAYQLQLLMMGAIVSASRGDLEAGRRAREHAELLLSVP